MGDLAVKLLLFLIVAYLLVSAVFFFAQSALLFPVAQAESSGPLPAKAERLSLDLPAGDRLQGVRIPGLGRGREGQPAILVFGGNGWNAQTAASYVHDLAPAYDVIAFHYRGYRPSEGTASAAALLADAPLIYDLAAETLGSRHIVAVGFSIGSGVAAHLAKQRTVAGLILVTPFDSLKAVAQGHYPWLPVTLLFRHDIRPAEDLRGPAAPVALIMAGDDTLIPGSRSAALRNVVPNLVLERTVPAVGHNDIYQSPLFHQAMRAALERIEEASAHE